LRTIQRPVDRSSRMRRESGDTIPIAHDATPGRLRAWHEANSFLANIADPSHPDHKVSAHSRSRVWASRDAGVARMPDGLVGSPKSDRRPMHEVK